MKDSFYTGYCESHAGSGEARLIIGERELFIETPFTRDVYTFADMEAITLSDYSVQIKADSRFLSVSRLGNACEWFYRELIQAYNQCVIRALLVDGQPLLKTSGQCRYEGMVRGADIHVYPDCLCVLPPDITSRRIPFVFLNELKRISYTLCLSLTTGEQYEFSMLGRDLDPLYRSITDQLHILKDKNRNFNRMLDHSVADPEQHSAKTLLQEGVAALPVSLPDNLAGILDGKVRNSKMSGTYALLGGMVDPVQMATGIKGLTDQEVESVKEKMLAELADSAAEDCELTAEQEESLHWMIWVIAPGRNSDRVIVEFCFPQEDAATYLFSFDHTYESMLMLLNRGLEATKLGREVFSLSEQQLNSAAYADARMLVVRTPALQSLRRQYIGRVIHHSLSSWQKGVEAHLTKTSSADETGASRFCVTCGARLGEQVRFCPSCGRQVR
ncbi:MAG: zinc ribbon domain-containing protein [Ruminococcaceae bacterium]|nr:zinc ribbon domain-containing protein [Oscillospiraceae bacterium]